MLSARTRRKAPWASVMPILGLCTTLLTDARCAQAAAPAPGKASAPSGDDQTPPRGVDIGKLDEFERKVFFRIVNHEPSACGKGHSLLHSAKLDQSCRASFYAVRYVAHLVDSGFTDSEIGDKLEKRFRTPRVPRFDLAAAPSQGATGAGRVTLVEFVDYECPHCQHAQALLHQAIEAYPKDARLFFKHFPLGGHPGSTWAAEGAVAAHKQGKFWAFNEKLWTQSDPLTPALLTRIAKEIGLDVARWRKDADSDAVKERVQADRSEGDELGINGTPTLYINGRKYTDPLDIASLKDWVDEELGR
jgi:glutaredoxin